MSKYEPPLEALLKRVGGPAKLSAALGVVPSCVTNWRRIPLHRVQQISQVTGIPKYELRPDQWEPPPCQSDAA